MRKNPGIAALLSFIIPGAGQIYCERLVRGIAFFIIGLILVFNSFDAMTLGWLIGVRIVAFAFWVYNIFDSKRIADRWNDDHN